MDLRKTARILLREGIASVLPDSLIKNNVKLTDDTLSIGDTPFALENEQMVHVYGSGKASFEMAKAVHGVLGDRFGGGIVVSNYMPDEEISDLKVLQGGHPVLNENSVSAADMIVEEMSSLGENDFFLYLLSGGSSALLERPAESLSLEEIQEVNRLLLANNVTISEVNTVRKHLSAVKGGQMGAAIKSRGVVLVISDVIGDDLRTIGSGPLYCDPTTFGDAKEIISCHRLWDRVPANVRDYIELGVAGKVPETPKESNPLLSHFILGNNMRSLKAIETKAESLGLSTHIMTSSLEGEAREVGKVLVAIAKEIISGHGPFNPPVCLLFGGETTVKVDGDGKGGRNQELALAALKSIGDSPGVLLASVGTDGIDGNSDAAGALADASGLEKARAKALDSDQYLAKNDSYNFFRAIDGLIFTGPTGTNVMDLTMILVT